MVPVTATRAWRNIGVAVVLTLAFLFGVGAPAEGRDAPRTITWDHLLPSAEPLVDPFSSLSNAQRMDLETIYGTRAALARGAGGEFAAQLSSSTDDMVRRLERQGLDVEALLDKVRDFEAEIIRRGDMLEQSLDGKTIRMPGYALPVAHQGRKVSRFLLVPYVGACIHVPPPPLNQTVFVSAREPFEMEELFMPFWITGEMSVKRVSEKVDVYDGQIQVDAGYVIDASSITPYKE